MPLRQWSKASLVVLALALWVGVGLIAPHVMSLSSNEQLGDSVEASTADVFSLEQPLVLSTVPPIRVERGTGLFVDSAGKPLPPGTQPPVRQGNLRLVNALLVVSGVGPTALRADGIEELSMAAPFAHLLASGSYQTLSLRRSSVRLSMASGDDLNVSDVSVDISLQRAGHVAIKGHGVLKGRRVQIESYVAPALVERVAQSNVSRTPLKLAVKSEFVEATFDGRLVATPADLWLEGPADINVSSARALARWLGALWPTGNGLRNISIRGLATAKPDEVTFDKATVRMDGNEGTGVVGLRPAGNRPVVSGTLAFKTLDISPYFTPPSLTSTLADNFHWASLTANLLTVPLGRHVDADLRLSADRVIVGKSDIGPAAATIALKDGQLLADVAGLSIGGMEGGGQLSADFNDMVPKVTMRGKFDRVDLGQVAGLLGVQTTMQGRANIRADVVGHGSTLRSVLESATGKLLVRSTEAGRLGFDIKRLSAAVEQSEVIGWAGLSAGRQFSYSSMDLRLLLRDGTVLAERAELKDAEGTWTINGLINVPADRVDIRLRHSPAATTAAARASTPAIEIKGSLHEPRIRAEAVR